MSVLFINEENLPRVDALIVTLSLRKVTPEEAARAYAEKHGTDAEKNGCGVSVTANDGIATAKKGDATNTAEVGEGSSSEMLANIPVVTSSISCLENSDIAKIIVPPMSFATNRRYDVIREVKGFLAEVMDIAREAGYTSLAMRFPAIHNRTLIFEFLNVPFVELIAGFDIDIYIIVDDRQKRMMRATLDIDDEIEPVMYCRKIPSSSVRPPIASCESAIPPETSSASVKPPKKSARPRPSHAMAEMEVDECGSLAADDFFDEPPSLADFIRDMDDTFAVRLLKLIDKKGMSEVECYKAANVSRQTWYKIMNEKDYRPSKNTVICFAISLHLTYEETQALLATAGFILSGSILFDKIIAYCIREGNYDIFSINAMLYSYDAECLGA